MEKTLYAVMYFGNAKRYHDLNYEIEAFTKREAVEKFYAAMLDENYFPDNPNIEFGGYVFDCDKNLIAYPGGEDIRYDGGHFYAEPVIQ